ncbi:MAG: hypothetical protein IPH32_09800 [Bacteroidetes bacterium]|nr:hypothetical protein [Bacteroidota bacterium]
MAYADRQVLHLLKCCLKAGFMFCCKEMNINRVFKMADTCAVAEFEAKTPYCYFNVGRC